jgi:hypothetical protein
LVLGATNVYTGTTAIHTGTVRTLLTAPDLTLAGSAGTAARTSAEHRRCTDMLALLDRRP